MKRVAGLVFGGLLVLAFSTGCGQQISGTASAADAPAEPGGAPASESSDSGAVQGKWTGEYDCGQGRTGLTLTIEAPKGDTVTGVVDFYPLPENPGVATGSYSIEGTITADGIRFRPGDWIEEALGYVMVPLDVVGPVEGEQMSGDMVAPECGGFSVRKAG